MKYLNYCRMGLQAFAESRAGEGGSDPDSEGTGGVPPTNSKSQDGPGKKPQDQGKDPQEPDKKYTDADVDRIINRKFAEWEKRQQAKVDEARKLAEMNAQEKAEYQAEQFRKELEELKRKDTLAQMSKEARKMLSEDEINIPDELLSHLVSEDAEDTKAAVTAFAKLFKDSVQEEVKNKLKGSAPRKGAGSTITREQIDAVKNTAERQKLIAENIHLYQ